VLNSYALALFERMRAADPPSRFLFPGDRPDSHLVDIKKGWAKITTAAGLDDFHFHDLRHVFGQHLERRRECRSP